MKKKMYFLLLLAVVGLCVPAKAVLVNIPDANFRAKLQTLYPACFVGAQMETTCVGITSATYLSVNNANIVNLSGIEYFTSLTNLSFHDNQLTSLPTNFPITITVLNCEFNLLTILPVLPPNLLFLYCNGNQLVSLPTLPSSLLDLACPNNQLTTLPVLPSGLQRLGCYGNQLDFNDLEAINPKPATYGVSPQGYKILPVSQSLLGGATLTISGAIGGTFNVYKWYKDNVLISGATSATYTKANATTADAGVYKCEVTSTYVGLGTTTGVTIISSNVTITITENPTTSIDNFLSSLVKISPNPSNGDFSIDFSGLSIAKSLLCVYDAQGKTVFSSNLNNNNNNNNFVNISLKNAPNGIYLLQINTEKGSILKRIVKAD